MGMNATIQRLVEEFGEKPGCVRLAGWQDISGEKHIAAKPEYTVGDGVHRAWCEGFAELVDGRIVYRGYYGDVLLAPPEYQPATIASAAKLIKLAVEENRTVTEYPATQEEYDSLLEDLLASSDGDVDTAEHSGAGYSGSESRGRTEIWSEDGWRVDLIHPSR